MNVTFTREPAPITSATLVLSRGEVLAFVNAVERFQGSGGVLDPIFVAVYQVLKEGGNL